MGTILQNIQNIPTDKPVIFYCEKGIRSAIVIQKLEERLGYTNLINLTGSRRLGETKLCSKNKCLLFGSIEQYASLYHNRLSYFNGTRVLYTGAIYF